MVLDDHICPWGLKVRHLLRAHGFAVEEYPLTTRAAVDAFKAEHDVKTTPQVWIGGERIGGHDDVARYLGVRVPDPKALTYAPVVAIFGMAAAMALAAAWSISGTVWSVRAVEWFVAFAMCLLALQKLRDIEGFATQFLGYDLLAQRWVPYARLYPWLEALAGVLMIAGALHWLSIPVALVIGGVGAVSVTYAVYVQKRDLKCACVGGNSNVPLGFVSLAENLMMIGMAIWMLFRA
jgi:glutaredoxin